MIFAEDIFFLEDNLLGGKQFIVGSVKNNCSVKMSYQQYMVTKAVYEILSNEKGKIENIIVEEKIKATLKVKIDLSEMLKQLEEKGLLEHCKPENQNSEVDKVGIPLFKVCFGHIPEILYKIADAFAVLKWFEYITIVLAALYVMVQFKHLENIVGEHLYTFQNSAIKGVGVSLIISIVVIFIHEIAHILEALRKRMRQGQFRIILYAGFIPMYFTKYPEIIRLKGKDKISILLAGIRTNVTMLMIALACMGLAKSEFVLNLCGLIILVNLNFIIINISPFTLNDGYNILMISLGLSGLRIKMWKFIEMLWKHDKTIVLDMKHKLLFMVYTLTSMGFICGNLYLTVEWIKRIVVEIIT